MGQCTICGTRPRPKDNRRLTCIPCGQLLARNEAEERARRRSAPTYYPQYRHILHWRGELVGLRPKCNGMLQPVYIGWDLNLRRVPQSKLINLDTWIPGYTPEQIKRMKGIIRRLAPSSQRIPRRKVTSTN